MKKNKIWVDEYYKLKEEPKSQDPVIKIIELKRDERKLVTVISNQYLRPKPNTTDIDSSYRKTIKSSIFIVYATTEDKLYSKIYNRYDPFLFGWIKTEYLRDI